jgi:ubiquinol-cytochrome c reductase cytochrome c subunit
MMNRCAIVTLVLAVAGMRPQASQESKASLENGKRVYLSHGCYQCHGTVGQGGVAGPRLAQPKRPLADFVAFVRKPPPGNMPPYRARVMSDAELADVYAYTKTFPEPAPAGSIAILKD